MLRHPILVALLFGVLAALIFLTANAILDRLGTN